MVLLTSGKSDQRSHTHIDIDFCVWLNYWLLSNQLYIDISSPSNAADPYCVFNLFFAYFWLFAIPIPIFFSNGPCFWPLCRAVIKWLGFWTRRCGVVYIFLYIIQLIYCPPFFVPIFRPFWSNKSCSSIKYRRACGCVYGYREENELPTI